MSQKEPEKKYDLCGTIWYSNRRSSWSTDNTTSYEGDDRHVKRLVVEWSFDQCVPASSPPTKGLDDKVEHCPKLEYKVGRTIAKVTLHEFGQTGYHPGITDSVKAHVEACDRNKARCGPHDQDICKPIKDVSAISRRKLAKTIDSLMCSVTVVG